MRDACKRLRGEPDRHVERGEAPDVAGVILMIVRDQRTLWPRGGEPLGDVVGDGGEGRVNEHAAHDVCAHLELHGAAGARGAPEPRDVAVGDDLKHRLNDNVRGCILW